MPSLYESLGGSATVDAAVDIFSRSVLADERIARFFEAVDVERRAAVHRAFLTMAFGGPTHVSGEDMARAHARLVADGLDDTHVDLVIQHLGDTLRELGVADALIAQIAAIVESARDHALGRRAAGDEAAVIRRGA